MWEAHHSIEEVKTPNGVRYLWTAYVEDATANPEALESSEWDTVMREGMCQTRPGARIAVLAALGELCRMMQDCGFTVVGGDECL